MRVTVTRFFRDPPVWSALEETVLPALASSLPPEQPFRAWSAGCAGGEEAYTLAMVWSLLHEGVARGHRLEIRGTDIDETALARAHGARYDFAALSKIPPELRDRCFVEQAPGAWRIAEALRDLARFERSDLLTDRPPANQQLVLCRYLAFTYYRGQRLRAAAKRLCSAIVPGGALVIGLEEHISGDLSDLIETWPGVPAVFRVRED